MLLKKTTNKLFLRIYKAGFIVREIINEEEIEMEAQGLIDNEDLPF